METNVLNIQSSQNKLKAFRPATLLKRDSNTSVFLQNLQTF